MTDCSCEGFTEIVKSWLAGGSFFFPPLLLLLPFLSLLFLSLLGRARAEVRQRQKGEKCWMAGVQELVTSCLIFGRGAGGWGVGPSGLYDWGRSSGSSHRDLPLWGEKKRVIQGAWKRRGGTLACAPHKHTFLLVLTCISKPLTRFSWKQIRYTCKCARALARTHTTREEHAQTAHAAGLRRCLLSPSPPFALYEVQPVLFFWTCWN